MNSRVNVVFRDISHSPALNETIVKKLQKLQRYSDAILHSRVVLNSPHKHKHKGKLYRASIELGLKGMPVIITHDAPSVHLAVRDAFSAAERRLKETTQKQRIAR